MFLPLVEGLSDVRIRGMSFKIDKENVFPGLPLVGSGLDLGQIDPFFIENLKDPEERSRGMGDDEKDRGLVPPCPFGSLAPEDQETRSVVRVILDLGGTHFEPVEGGS